LGSLFGFYVNLGLTQLAYDVYHEIIKKTSIPVVYIHQYFLSSLVTDSPHVTVTNISSTALYAHWTKLPNSTEIYAKLLGYYVYVWKKSDVNSSFVVNATVKNYILMEDMEKWTTYCFNVSGYTGAGVGPPSETQCTRTFEDGKLSFVASCWHLTS
jgi:hypothetical protein